MDRIDRMKKKEGMMKEKQLVFHSSFLFQHFFYPVYPVHPV
jgi:hypothetical protein